MHRSQLLQIHDLSDANHIHLKKKCQKSKEGEIRKPEKHNIWEILFKISPNNNHVNQYSSPFT